MRLHDDGRQTLRLHQRRGSKQNADGKQRQPSCNERDRRLEDGYISVHEYKHILMFNQKQGRQKGEIS
jgi:hypothetical protein